MRITFVSACADLSGGSRAIAVHAERLRRRGHQVTVVARPPRQPTWKARLNATLHGRRLKKPCLSSHYDETGVERRTVPATRPVTADDVPDGDVIVATWWETAEWIAGYPDRKGVKVHFIQDYEVWGGNTERVDATCRLPMAKITPAAWVKDLLKTKFDVDGVWLVPNAVDLERFHAPPRGKQPVPTVGFTYTPFLNKGCDVMLKAFDLARQSVPALRLVTFGSSPVTRELPLPEGAEHHERAPEAMLKSLYGKCDAWLFGTRREGFGLPILEAMACRTPVIATGAGAAPQLVGQGGGLLVPFDDPPAMARAIERVASLSDSEWRELSDKAYATASGYTWEDAVDRFERALSDAVRGGRAPFEKDGRPNSAVGTPTAGATAA